jgi:hypothetical protein
MRPDLRRYLISDDILAEAPLSIVHTTVCRHQHDIASLLPSYHFPGIYLTIFVLLETLDVSEERVTTDRGVVYLAPALAADLLSG